jgi:hypothetical protein
LDNASLTAARNLPEWARVAAGRLGAYSVPLRVIEGVIHIAAKFSVQTFVERKTLSERDIPIVLPGSPHHTRVDSSLNTGWGHDECIRIEILRVSPLGVGEIRVAYHVQASQHTLSYSRLRATPSGQNTNLMFNCRWRPGRDALTYPK